MILSKLKREREKERGERKIDLYYNHNSTENSLIN